MGAAAARAFAHLSGDRRGGADTEHAGSSGGVGLGPAAAAHLAVSAAGRSQHPGLATFSIPELVSGSDDDDEEVMTGVCGGGAMTMMRR